jgi:ribonuclease PH
MEKLGERQVVVDCDVLQADGGTRVASICGGYLALHDALSRLILRGQLLEHPITEACAAVSVGIIHGQPRLDLPYEEDSNADTDMNVVMTESGGFIEIQGTAEQASFNRNELDSLLSLAEKGIREIIELQNELTNTQPTI